MSLTLLVILICSSSFIFTNTETVLPNSSEPSYEVPITFQANDEAHQAKYHKSSDVLSVTGTHHARWERLHRFAEQKFNVSGIITLFPIQKTSCSTKVKQMIEHICVRAKQNLTSGNLMEPIQDFFASVVQASEDLAELARLKVNSKRSHFETVMVHNKIKSTIEECCYGTKQCNEADVRHQIEDACIPAMHGSRPVHNA